MVEGDGGAVEELRRQPALLITAVADGSTCENTKRGHFKDILVFGKCFTDIQEAGVKKNICINNTVNCFKLMSKNIFLFLGFPSQAIYKCTGEGWCWELHFSEFKRMIQSVFSIYR